MQPVIRKILTPTEAREFLKGMKGPDGFITHLIQRDGKELTIDEASDFQVQDIAQDFYDAMLAKEMPLQ